jgi:hypothetical protein
MVTLISQNIDTKTFNSAIISKNNKSNYIYTNKSAKNNTNTNTQSKNSTNSPTQNTTTNNNNSLSAAEQSEVQKLQEIDKRVKAHEQAHLSAGAGLISGGASYNYTMGPDGKIYAVGGEVKIDISPIADNPRATIQKMEKVISAALAPVDPSSQDRAVAANASQIELSAEMELSKSTISDNNSQAISSQSKSKSNISNNNLSSDNNQMKNLNIIFDKPNDPYISLNDNKNPDSIENFQLRTMQQNKLYRTISSQNYSTLEIFA